MFIGMTSQKGKYIHQEILSTGIKATTSTTVSSVLKKHHKHLIGFVIKKFPVLYEAAKGLRPIYFMSYLSLTAGISRQQLWKFWEICFTLHICVVMLKRSRNWKPKSYPLPPYLLTADLFLLFSKALIFEVSSRFRLSLLGLGFVWEGWEESVVAADNDEPNRSCASVQSNTIANQFQEACSCWSINVLISDNDRGLGERQSAGRTDGL